MKHYFWLLVGLAGSAQAVIIRHDKADQLYKDLGNQAQYACVGRINFTVGTATGVATGVFIGTADGKSWLLTAAHAMSSGTATAATVTFGTSTFDLNMGSRSTFNANGTFTPGLDDLALLRITGFNAAITRAKFYNRLLTVGAAVDQKPLVTHVGYGRTGTGNTGETANSEGTKRGFRNRIDAIGTTRTSGGTTETDDGYLADFDNNTDAKNTLDKANYDPLPNGQRSSKVWEDLEGLTAPGDSGGGLFADINSNELLVGILSYGLSFGDTERDYGDWSGWTPINREKADWISLKTGINSVPEPTTMIALAGGLMAVLRRRRPR